MGVGWIMILMPVKGSDEMIPLTVVIQGVNVWFSSCVFPVVFYDVCIMLCGLSVVNDPGAVEGIR